MLHIEEFSSGGRSLHTARVPLQYLTDKFSEEKTGSYFTKPAILLMVGPVALLVFYPVLFADSRIGVEYPLFAYLLWFAAVALIAARHDVRFSVYAKNGIDVVEIVGRSGCRNRIRQFVESIIHHVRESQ
jgi:hypothetical protein